jgi:hypothetical protein
MRQIVVLVEAPLGFLREATGYGGQGAKQKQDSTRQFSCHGSFCPSSQ